MNKKEQAIANHKKGYNCAQSVACLYASEFGFKEEDVFKLVEAFGLGMGTMDTCGVVSAMAVIVGMKNSDGNLAEPKTKGSSYKLMKELTKEFEAKNKTTICRELKGVDTGTVIRSCDGCIEDAVSIIENKLLGRNL